VSVFIKRERAALALYQQLLRVVKQYEKFCLKTMPRSQLKFTNTSYCFSATRCHSTQAQRSLRKRELEMFQPPLLLSVRWPKWSAVGRKFRLEERRRKKMVWRRHRVIKRK